MVPVDGRSIASTRPKRRSEAQLFDQAPDRPEPEHGHRVAGDRFDDIERVTEEVIDRDVAFVRRQPQHQLP